MWHMYINIPKTYIYIYKYIFRFLTCVVIFQFNGVKYATKCPLFRQAQHRVGKDVWVLKIVGRCPWKGLKWLGCTLPKTNMNTQTSWMVEEMTLAQHWWPFIARFNTTYTLPETNMFAPENRPSQKEISIPTIHFQVRTVSFREGRLRRKHGEFSTNFSNICPWSCCESWGLSQFVSTDLLLKDV